MTYFRTGCRTIIGAVSFHAPVRDGKGWFQDAMAARQSGFATSQTKLGAQCGKKRLGFDCISASSTHAEEQFKAIGSSRTGN